MGKKIVIQNYDLKRKSSLNLERGVSYFGFDIEDKHYIIRIKDPNKDSILGKGNLIIPKNVFELISYDEKTETAKARKITDKTLIEKIAVELHMEDYYREGRDEHF